MSESSKAHSQMLYYGNTSDENLNILKGPCLGISKEHLQYLINVGKALHKLEELAKHDLFDDLSKHNTYWQSAHEDEYEKLDELRRRLMWISEKIWDAISLLEIEIDDDGE